LGTFSRNPFDFQISRSSGARPSYLLWATALTAIAALLITVAVLQYRWTGQASSAEEMRIGAELESLMMKWHSDLYGEFSAICIAMQVGPDSGARDTWNDYLERYVEWNYALPHESSPYVYRNPDLVGEIYIWETGGKGKPTLFWLNLDRKRIEPSKVPLELVDLLPRLEATSANLPMAMNAWRVPSLGANQRDRVNMASTSVSTGSNPIAGWQFDVKTPAIVHPILHHGADKKLNPASPIDWIVITMDMNVLQQRVLPKLATRYFGGLDGLDYNAAVIATGPNPRTIYSSDPGFETKGIGAVDSSLNIFGTPLETGRGISNGRSLETSQWQSFVGPVWFPVIDYGSSSGDWLLEVQHRAGPLQVVIRRVRQKNLTVSAFVLLLLALNIGVMTIAGFRAQKFARLQMDFVASVSHELRTPLTVIYSAGENIRDGVVTERNGLEHYGALVIAQARQLMKNVDRILLFASIRSGKDRYSLRPIEVSEILRRVRNDTSALLVEESCTIEQKVETAVTRVLADPMAVSSCLENLVTNAIKYSGGDCRISLTAALEWSEDKGYQVAFNVEDHGIGIDSSELKHIFEPFYRGPKAVSLQIHGTGLGLSLAKHFAEAMNGNLSVVSKIGVGSIFTLRLPVPRAEEQELAIAGPLRSEGDRDERKYPLD
jgi:signal transduction histidine kinase